MTDFFREVDEEVRRDKAVDFFRKYMFWFIGFFVVIVAVTGVWRAMLHYGLEASEKSGATYENALDLARQGKFAEAQAAFEAIKAPAGYRTLARLSAIDELAKTDKEAAIKAYEALAGDSSYDSSLAPVARLRAALLQVDTQDSKAFEQSVSAMAGPTAPFRSTARELLALSALKRGDYEAAGRWLDEIVSDPEVPTGIRSRAEAFLGFVRAGKPSE